MESEPLMDCLSIEGMTRRTLLMHSTAPSFRFEIGLRLY